MSETLKHHGAALTLTSKQTSTLQDAAGNAWTIVSITSKGAQLNVNGANSTFPNSSGNGYMVSQVYFGNDEVIYAEGYANGWKKYVGAAWIATNNPRDM